MIYKSRIDSRTVVDITGARLSQQEFVHILGTFVTPISVHIINSSERCATDDTYMKVDCDDTSFIDDVVWIVQYVILILFRSNNLKLSCKCGFLINLHTCFANSA